MREKQVGHEGGIKSQSPCELDLLWEDVGRVAGLPILFTWYRLYPNRLVYNTGLLFKREEELLLYRVRDVTVWQAPLERLLSLGTVELRSTDSSDPVLELRGIREPYRVRDMIRDCVERERARVGVRQQEFLGGELGHWSPAG